MGKWLGKANEPSKADQKRLANDWREVATETELDAVGKPAGQDNGAAERAKSMRQFADDIDPDVK